MNIAARVLCSVVVLALSGCAGTSKGLEMKPDAGKAPVSFDWRSTDDVSGDMTAWLPDGRMFRGPYLQSEGKILANLNAADGEHMLCRFRLTHPSSGMRDGGHGVCQLTAGMTIDAVF